MRHFDLSPLYRSTVGFDRLFNMLDNVATNAAPSYPPYNIEKTGENTYRISMAVAGFGEKNLQVEVKQNALTVRGEQSESESEESREVLYRGIAARSFERRFQLADHVQVTNAKLENGLLHLDLVRHIPEEEKPRTIAIQNGDVKTIEAQVQ